MAGGNPWTGGGRGSSWEGPTGLQGISGTFTVGGQLGPNQYQFTCTVIFP